MKIFSGIPRVRWFGIKTFFASKQKKSNGEPFLFLFEQSREQNALIFLFFGSVYGSPDKEEVKNIESNFEQNFEQIA